VHRVPATGSKLKGCSVWGTASRFITLKWPIGTSISQHTCEYVKAWNCTMCNLV
jgi:hypothetical protein